MLWIRKPQLRDYTELVCCFIINFFISFSAVYFSKFSPLLSFFWLKVILLSFFYPIYSILEIDCTCKYLYTSFTSFDFTHLYFISRIIIYHLNFFRIDLNYSGNLRNLQTSNWNFKFTFSNFLLLRQFFLLIHNRLFTAH